MQNPLDKLDNIQFLNLVQDILECEQATNPPKTKTSIQMEKWVRCMRYELDFYSTFHEQTFFTIDELKRLHVSGIYAFAYLRISKECSHLKDCYETSCLRCHQE